MNWPFFDPKFGGITHKEDRQPLKCLPQFNNNTAKLPPFHLDPRVHKEQTPPQQSPFTFHHDWRQIDGPGIIIASHISTISLNDPSSWNCMPLELHSSKIGIRNSYNLSKTLHHSRCNRKKGRPAHFSIGQSVKNTELGSVPFTVSHRTLMVVYQISSVISANKPAYLESGLVNEHNFGRKNSS